MGFFAKWVERAKWARVSEKKKREYIDSLWTQLRAADETWPLISLAAKDEIYIGFRTELLSTSTLALYDTSARSIELNPELLYNRSSALQALAHELRHHWQYKTLGIDCDQEHSAHRTPRLSFIFNRVAEMDAYSFGEKIRRKFSKDAADFGYMSMSSVFSRLAGNETVLASYDWERAELLHLWHTAPDARPKDFENVKSVPELTVARIRGILKDGVSAESPNYLANLTDAQFENLVLAQADKKALGLVDLIENFNAAAVNDKDRAAALRVQAQKVAQHNNGGPA